MKIYCFGDSLTYGYDARSLLGERLPARDRWPDILAAETGWVIVNAGMNGRTIPKSAAELTSFDRGILASLPVDVITIMLGTNDILSAMRPDADNVAADMERFIRHILELEAVREYGARILLISPPLFHVDEDFSWMDLLGDNEDVCAPEQSYDSEMMRLGECYREVAQRCQVGFADAADWDIALAYDGVHLAPEGNRTLAARLGEVLASR